MKSKLVLESTVYTLDQLALRPEPQIALAGRSNVGKSSLVNALANRKQLAKVSSTPGKTRSINFYRVEPEGFFVVDLPGYGYAQCSKTERQKWAMLIEKYVTSCKSLMGLAVLLDTRLPPQKLDVELTGFARAHNIPLLPILTKADKCKQQERAARAKEWAVLLDGQRPVITSSRTGLGMESLWGEMRRLTGHAPQPAAPAHAPAHAEDAQPAAMDEED